MVENELNKQDEFSEMQETDQQTKKDKPKYNVDGTIYSFLVIFGIVFLSCLFVFQILLTPIKVVGKSMQPTINSSVLSEEDEDHNDFVYYRQSSKYDNNEIVIVSNAKQNYVKDADVQYFIKRVVACPGQTITFALTDQQTSGLIITYFYDIVVTDQNGTSVKLETSFLTEDMSFSSLAYAGSSSIWFKTIFENLTNPLLPLESRKYSLTLNEDQYFVMGDNRGNSNDSRFFGPVTYEDISGDVKLHVPHGKTIFYGIWKFIVSIF